MKSFLPIFFSLTLMACPSSLADLVETPLTTADIARGLKEALNLGAEEAVQSLSKKDGFYRSAYKILLPEEARVVTDRLQVIPGFDKVEEVLLEKINHAAEDAVKSAGPIFWNAITSMTIDDAMGILMGENDAATSYLQRTTYDPLYGEFQPILLESLNKFNALDYWEDAVNTYNKIPLLSDVNPRLDDYIAHEALNRLFTLIELKEIGIRTDISQRVTPLLQKVFKKQDAA